MSERAQKTVLPWSEAPIRPEITGSSWDPSPPAQTSAAPTRTHPATALLRRGFVRHAQAFVVLLAAVLVGCGQEGGGPRGLVVLVVDTLRADHLGTYGYTRPTSPRVDAFAADATVFENAVAPSPWTLPSVATLLTSLYPSVHGAQIKSDVWNAKWLVAPKRFRPASDLDDSHTTLAEILVARGFATAAFVQGAYPSRVFGFAQGFDRFDDNASPGLRFDVEAALAWLDERRPRRFLVYLHSVEVHSPYGPPRIKPTFMARWPEKRRAHFTAAVEEERRRFLSVDFDPDYRGSVDGSVDGLIALGKQGRVPARDLEHLVALYDRGIVYTDYWFGELLDGLEARGLLETSVVVLTADHGEEFLEHAGMQHGRTYFEEMLRVPLIVRVPGLGRGRRVSNQAGLVDVLPTLLDVLEIRWDGAIQGRSLLPLLHGEQLPERPVYGEASMAGPRAAVRTNEWKYVQDDSGREELYDLQRDPRERTERCQAETEVCTRLRERLAAFRDESAAMRGALGSPDSAPAELDGETRALLEELGYLRE